MTDNKLDQYALLNENQRKAVFAADSPMIIFAGAGSGKTKVVTCRIK
ncbi:MAG: UvrD-helicase domain-containing protein [Epsilonproteobacteria bacterium]|nr:UvrD-helicase domain-containing protein [Campylobacterota bacterium]